MLLDGDVLIWEGNAIARYLAAKYGDASLFPHDLQRRADIERWLDYQLSTIRAPLHTLLRDVLDPAAVARNGARLAEVMEPVEETLQTQRYLGGDAFSIADIPVGINAYRWQLLDVPHPPMPALEDWLERLRARPAFIASICPPIDTRVALQLK